MTIPDASSHHLCCNATIIYDCKSACDLLLSKVPPDERSGYWCQARDALARCAANGLKVRWVWVPSHGKRPDFRCASFSSELARRLNDLADAAATAALVRIARSSGRQNWCSLRDTARARTSELFAYAAAVAQLLGASL